MHQILRKRISFEGTLGLGPTDKELKAFLYACAQYGDKVGDTTWQFDVSFQLLEMFGKKTSPSDQCERKPSFESKYQRE